VQTAACESSSYVTRQEVITPSYSIGYHIIEENILVPVYVLYVAYITIKIRVY
jgi:hypothetical protein